MRDGKDHTGLRHAASLGVLIVFMGFNLATSKSKPGGTSPPPTIAPAPVPTTAATLADVDVAKIDKELCAGKKNDGCRTLKDFDAAAAFSAFPQSGELRFVGYAHALGGTGDGKYEYAFAKMKPGAGTIAPPAGTAEPYSGAIRTLKPDNASEEKDTHALVTALSAGKPAPKGSGAADFVRTTAPPNGWDTLVKAGRSLVTINARGEKRYLRASGNRILVVEYAETGTMQGYALQARAFVSELWPLP